ncbi:MAG: hypothetical protein ACRDHD_02925 [Candidatus Limnocylindria bacterium]
MQRLPIFENNNFASTFTLKRQKGNAMNLSAKQPNEDMVRSLSSVNEEAPNLLAAVPPEKVADLWINGG